MSPAPSLGATCGQDGRCQFRVWAPCREKVELHVVEPDERLLPLRKEACGYFQAGAEGVGPGSLYFYRLDGQLDRPDPASRFQPRGVHGPSQVTDAGFPWEDVSWHGLPLQRYVIYELHVGAFTPEGTFDALVPYLDELADLGVTAVELMPVAQFPGGRNWGYDGVDPYAVQSSYGGPQGLKRLVNACHGRGLAVVLDVVYNHLGPEGNYLADFGPYFTNRYQTPWGQALNFDGAGSDGVRRFFIENALYWVTDFHIDALRLDAVHAIFDHSARPFVAELAQAVLERAAELNRRVYLIAESSANDPRLVQSRELGGYGLDAQWSSDFHHSLHALLTGERTGYYQDYGRLHHLAKAFREGYVYSGEYSPYRGRRHGVSSRRIPAPRFVVCAQNHDVVGNRIGGERLAGVVSFEGLKLAVGLVVLSPFVPLLFMGEEYGETAPFHYFVSHSDPDLVEAVRRGRREEFAAFRWRGEPPDPGDEATFQRAKLDHGLRRDGSHNALRQFYREALRLRREIPSLARLSKDCLEVAGYERAQVLFLRRWSEMEQTVAAFHSGEESASIEVPVPAGCWRKLLDSADERWHGPGSEVPGEITSVGGVELHLGPRSFVLFQNTCEG